MPKKPPISEPKKVSVAEQLIDSNVEHQAVKKDKKRQKNRLNKYIVTMTFPPEMEEVLKKEAEVRGMTVAGFLKFCAAKEINK